ncbi:tRNA pseudouridine(38-40) synthase TruA [Parvibium lacunae]|uniref:tRNA pseudouridine synthase A n=1 Tax=Parvibium lacunae TaxID=1888893 RepID=A0A368L840_9BURK|nr:tRNA pseudouridine(38-40) synthase TruA [Parvibium lacunae]RCS59823.1 tRNA pseudouridine(38-40) synthase TruA [Parvibium lacunae]
MRIALGIEYDGQPWQGWQTQPSGLTVQDTLERALRQFVGDDTCIPTICAGRTDAGVHATAQVVSFDIPDVACNRPAHAWIRGVNAFLPPSIAVRWAQPVASEFNARFSATARRYEYWLYTDPVRLPHWHGRMAWYHEPLDIAGMQAAATSLLGTHDFSAFRSSQCQAKSPVRTLKELRISTFRPEAVGRAQAKDGVQAIRSTQILCFSLQADAFLHHMVRNLVGSLIYVGNGRQSPAWLREVLACRQRCLAAPTFAPDGLYLTQVQYPVAFGLPDAAQSPFRFYPDIQ